MANRALRAGHSLALLKGGETFFPALVDAITAARAEVLLETYIFDFTRSVETVAQALAAAAQRGVAVRVVVDGVGTDAGVPAEWQQRWQAAGVQWRVFNPAQGWRLLLPTRWRRMHRKLCVVDGTAFCGGINLLDDFFDPNYGALDQPRFDFPFGASPARSPMCTTR